MKYFYSMIIYYLIEICYNNLYRSSNKICQFMWLVDSIVLKLEIVLMELYIFVNYVFFLVINFVFQNEVFGKEVYFYIDWFILFIEK